MPDEFLFESVPFFHALEVLTRIIGVGRIPSSPIVFEDQDLKFLVPVQ